MGDERTKKNKILAVVFGTLCLLAGASWGTAAASSTYVGVSAGDSFEYSCTQTYSGEYYYKYTLDMTFTIDNVTNHAGYTTIGTHMYFRNATYNATSYWTETVGEGETVMNQSTVGYIINKNISNKSYNYHPDAGHWINGTWDANGVFVKLSQLYVSYDGDYYQYEITRKDSILIDVIVLAAIGIGVLGVFWYYKKSQDRNIFRELGTKVHTAVQRLRKPAQVQGTPLDWQCPGCGASIPRGSTYCLYCGEKVDSEPKAIPWPETPSVPSPETQPEPQAERNECPQPTPAKQPAPTGPIPTEVMETLTFIALQQPIVLLLIASRRGSAALEHVQILEDRGLVKRQGTGPTAPVVTTEHFADTFGLSRDVKKMKVELKTDLEL